MEESRMLQGFRGITLKLDKTSTVLRWMFIKQHAIRDQISEKPSDRTLFVINVPPFCVEHCLNRMFSVCGKVTSVYIHQVPNAALPAKETSCFFQKYPDVKGYRVAYIVFDSQDGVDAALKLDPMKPLVMSPPHYPLFIGLFKYRTDYDQSVGNIRHLQEEIDEFMMEYDKATEEKKMTEKCAMEADDEGWITVTKGGRKPGIRRTESVKNKIMGKEKLKRTKKELRNFYSFQIRESKMKNLQALRKKFEEDKKRLNALKQTRRFKPF